MIVRGKRLVEVDGKTVKFERPEDAVAAIESYWRLSFGEYRAKFGLSVPGPIGSPEDRETDTEAEVLVYAAALEIARYVRDRSGSLVTEESLRRFAVDTTIGGDK